MELFYLEFKTWKKGHINTPWPVVFLEDTADYRKISALDVKIPDKVIQAIFTNLSEDVWSRFLEGHVTATILGTIISCDNIDQATLQLENVFGVVEVVGHCIVSMVNIDQIRKIMGDDCLP